MIWQELNESLIMPGLHAATSDEVMQKMGSALIREGYAKESYIGALVEREAKFPTGLDIDGVGVAIPHTDVKHVLREGIAVATLAQPTRFIQMGGDGESVDVRLVFMLCVLDPHEHIEQLQTIVTIIQDKHVLQEILGCTNSTSIKEIIKKKEESL